MKQGATIRIEMLMGKASSSAGIESRRLDAFAAIVLHAYPHEMTALLQYCTSSLQNFHVGDQSASHGLNIEA